MNVHNLMEDIVSKNVNKLYEQLKTKKAAWLTCDCKNCRLDTISYVLNRVPPKYVVSGRGITHSAETLNDYQLMADVEAIALEGMRIVSVTKRPFHGTDSKSITIEKIKAPAFNFATISGTVLDGSTFEPLPDATIVLKCDGEVAEMIDCTFTNPFKTLKSTKGAFSFWMKPIPAEKAGVNRTFNLSLEISAEGYTPLVNHFEIPLISEDSNRTEVDSTFSIKLQDLVLFREDIVNEMDF